MISELLKLFKATAARFGFPEGLVNEIVFYLVLVGFVFFVLRQLYKLLIRFFLWNNQRRLNRDLHPYYSKSDVETLSSDTWKCPTSRVGCPGVLVGRFGNVRREGIHRYQRLPVRKKYSKNLEPFKNTRVH